MIPAMEFDSQADLAIAWWSFYLSLVALIGTGLKYVLDGISRHRDRLRASADNFYLSLFVSLTDLDSACAAARLVYVDLVGSMLSMGGPDLSSAATMTDAAEKALSEIHDLTKNGGYRYYDKSIETALAVFTADSSLLALREGGRTIQWTEDQREKWLASRKLIDVSSLTRIVLTKISSL